jgi:hypothetical protein
MRPYLHQQRVLRVLSPAIHLQPATARQGSTPRTLKVTLELLFEEMEHQVLGSTLLGAISREAIDR